MHCTDVEPSELLLPRTTVPSGLDDVPYFSVFLKGPLWLLFAVFSWEDLSLVRCGTSGNIVSCSSPFSKSLENFGSDGALSLYETWLNKYELRR